MTTPDRIGDHPIPPDDLDAVKACVDLVGRSGGRGFQIGYLHDDVPAAEAGWWAHAQFQGARISVEKQPGPAAAASALAVEVLTGAKCQCGSLVQLFDGGATFRGTRNSAATLADGTTWAAAEAEAAGQCRWVREGPRWVKGCERDPTRCPAPPWPNIPVEEQAAYRLAAAIERAGGSPWLRDRARDGWYDDFRSPDPMPITTLVRDLRKAGLDDLAERAMAGEFDAGPAESKAWGASAEGREVFAELVGGAREPRPAWSAPKPGAKPRRKGRR